MTVRTVWEHVRRRLTQVQRTRWQCAVLVFAIAVTVLLAPGAASAQVDDPMSVVTLTSALPKTGFTPGETFQAAILVDIKEGYHLNAHEVSDRALIPTEVEVPEDTVVSWPFVRYPEDLVKAGQSVMGLQAEQYHDRVIIRLVGRVPEDAAVGTLTAPLKVRYQTCTDTICLFPVSKPVAIAIPVVAAGTEVKAINTAIFGPPGGP